MVETSFPAYLQISLEGQGKHKFSSDQGQQAAAHLHSLLPSP